jgi:superfamily II DNA helicase RecQ
MTKRGGYLGGHTLMPERWKGHSDDDLRLIRQGRRAARKKAQNEANKRRQKIRELIALNAPGNRKPARSTNLLNVADFAVFTNLRRWRNTIAETEGVPVHAVFTNEQMAKMVRRRVDSLAALGEIDGIGPARLERYGAAVLECLRVEFRRRSTRDT